MGNVFYIGLLVIGVLSIYKDFIKTPGYILEKVLHVFFIFFLFSTNVTAFKNFFYFFRNYQTYGDWSTIAKLEYMSADIAFFFSISSSILGMIVYVLSFALLVRADFARKILTWVIPFYIFTMAPAIHHAYLNRLNSDNGMMKLGVGVSFLTIYVIIFFLYNGEKMKNFFHSKEINKIKNISKL